MEIELSEEPEGAAKKNRDGESSGAESPQKHADKFVYIDASGLSLSEPEEGVEEFHLN